MLLPIPPLNGLRGKKSSRGDEKFDMTKKTSVEMNLL